MGGYPPHLAVAGAWLGVHRPRLCIVGGRWRRYWWAGNWLGTFGRWCRLVVCGGGLTLDWRLIADRSGNGLTVYWPRLRGNGWGGIRRCGL